MIAFASDRERASLARLRPAIRTVDELLRDVPRRHVHRDHRTRLDEARDAVPGIFVVRVTRCGQFKRGKLFVLRADVVDAEGGRGTVFRFNRPYETRMFAEGRTLLLADAPEVSARGSVRFGGQGATIEVLDDESARRLEAGDVLPLYHATEVLTQARRRALAAEALQAAPGEDDDPLPAPMRTRLGLCSLAEAYRGAHAARSWDDWLAARRRLVFEQHFLLQAAIGRDRLAHAKLRKARAYVRDGDRLRRFRAALPWKLTAAQERTIGEVLADLLRPSPMNRLLQGDVGSGKTAVAAAALAATADSGFRSAVLAPTEILAEQHARTLTRLLAPAGIRVSLLTGGQSAGQRRKVLEDLAGSGADLLGSGIDVVVGTHALLEADVAIPRLGLAVIDERHKFGVRQREALERKGAHPDVLMMTATPLPRAMILTRYGDTTLSVLDELPPGREPVATTLNAGAMGRDRAYKEAGAHLAAGERVFAVFPLVEESESLLLRDATKEFDRLRKRFPDARAGLLHGRLPGEEKAAVMDRFARGEINLLVATSVVEVGIDVPEATVMLIEHADRFGLAQLHQLRGRVGRGGRAGICCLVTGARMTTEARIRLEALVRTTDGFALAETDLAIRGPGELLGTRQHGQAGDDLGDALLDADLMEAARREAEGVLAADPDLAGADGRRILRSVASRLSGPWALLRAS